MNGMQKYCMAKRAIGKTNERKNKTFLKAKANEFTTCLDILIYNTKLDEAHRGNI